MNVKRAANWAAADRWGNMPLKNLRELPKLRDSLSYHYVEHAKVEQEGHALALFDKEGETHLPIAALGVLLLGPGTSISHAAMKTLADSGCSVLWVGEEGMRMYGQGLGETRSARRLLRQAQLHGNPKTRAAVVYKMYETRFREPIPPGLDIHQLRGREGVRVRTAYGQASRESGVPWNGRNYDRSDWYKADSINRALSAAAACLYGICHCAIVATGYSAALGFIHTGKLLSFVYDIADLYRADVIVPAAFGATARVQAGQTQNNLERETRIACREAFRQHRVLERVVKDIDDLMRLDSEDLDRSCGLVDGSIQAPCALWDPDEGTVEGGVNHADDPASESSEQPEG